MLLGQSIDYLPPPASSGYVTKLDLHLKAYPSVISYQVLICNEIIPLSLSVIPHFSWFEFEGKKERYQ